MKKLVPAFSWILLGILTQSSYSDKGVIWGIVAAVVPILFLIIVFASANSDIKEWKSRKKRLASANKPTKDFHASTIINNWKSYYSFAIDKERRKVMIVFVNDEDDNAYKYIINFSDIISVELLEDSNTTFSKSTMRTIGGGIAGGVLAGSAGAIVGGLSGDNKVVNTVSRISVKLLLRNYEVPSITMDCLKDGSAENKSDSPFMQEARSIIDHLSVIIDMIDQESKTSTAQTNSVADELEKLCALKEKGFLTEEEFNQQKSRLLS